MFYFMSNVWSSQIVVKSFRIIFYNNLTLSFAFIFSFDVLFFQIFIKERFYEWVEFLLLVVTSRPPRVNEDSWTEDCSENFGFLISILVDVEDNQKVEVHSLVIIGSGGEFHSTEVNLSINHFHFSLSTNAHIDERQVLGSVAVGVLLDC